MKSHKSPQDRAQKAFPGQNAGGLLGSGTPKEGGDSAPASHTTSASVHQ